MGINQAPIIAGLRTRFYQATAGLIPQALGKGKIVAVVIQNRLSNIDNTGNPLELMIGDGTSQIYERLPGTESPILYANDLEDIWVRVRVAVNGVSDLTFPVIVYYQDAKS